MGRRVTLVAVAAVGLIISTVIFGVALALFTPADSGTPGVPSADEATDGYTSLSGLAMTRERTVRYPNGTERTVRAAVRLRPGQGAVYVRWLSPDDRAGRVVVHNASGRTVYDPDRGVLRRSQRTRSTAARVAYANFLDAAFSDDPGTTGEAVPTGTAPMPVLPGPRGDRADRFTFDSVHEVTYRGNATVDGHETLVFSLRPTTGPRNVTVWLERRHFVPVKVRRVVGDGSERQVTTVRHTDLRFDPGFGDEAFAVSPPDETAVVDNADESPRVEAFQSVAAANESAPFRVPDPEPPGRLRFGGAQVVYNETRPTVTLRYRPRTVTNDSTLLVVTKARTLAETSLSRASQNDTILRVAGQPAVYSPTAGGASALVSLRWRCDGYEYSVFGRANRTTAVTMAERIGCRAG